MPTLKTSSLTPSQKQAFIEFLEYTPPQRLSRNLRNLLLEYMLYEKDGRPLYLDDLLADIMGLFRLLDEVGE